ncbi:DUF1638 domain-containing protein [Methanomassiliicoccus luminyensis]|uniref:DUF1638 domain-containing protein n=1 Tax=Methanomassiliicoccus luminyensis TaxID=1080712 RepID=UPI000380F6C4|nr:DUF1638 domain-containing protein [Methanomassiliicoccus luminyensis]
MRIGIIACETFERGLDHITKGDPDIVHKEYLEFGLHAYPEELKKEVIDKVNSLEGKVDAVLLGYGVCNSLKDVTSQMKVPTVRLQADDCIGVLITPEEYDRERRCCAGTWYCTPYFANMNRDWFLRDLREKLPNYEELGIDIDWYMDKLFDGYARVLFVDDGLGDVDAAVAKAKEFAEQLNLLYESRNGRPCPCSRAGWIRPRNSPRRRADLVFYYKT